MKSNADSLPSNKTLTEVDKASETRTTQKYSIYFYNRRIEH